MKQVYHIFLATLLCVALLLTGTMAPAEEIEIEEVEPDTLIVETDEALELLDGVVEAPVDVLPLDLLPAENAPEIVTPNVGDVQSGQGTISVPVDLPDSDMLFTEYFKRELGLRSAVPVSNRLYRDRLNGQLAVIYDYLKSCFKKVAAGKMSSTAFRIPIEMRVKDMPLDYYVTMIQALIADCPYDLFWMGSPVVMDGYGDEDTWIVYFPVNPNYSTGDSYTVDTAKLKQASKAAGRAKAVVKKYAGRSDYEKLKAYATYICKNTSYDPNGCFNGLASHNGSMDAHQLIAVFDGDPSTSVVCEGYTKAFQYLCNLSSFKHDVNCISTCGMLDSNYHIWNVVTMEDGRNYMVDVTVIDDDNSNKPNMDMFMKGYKKFSDGVYTYRSGSKTLSYRYTSDTLSLYQPEALKLSATSYNPSGKVKAPASVTIAQGKTLELLPGDRVSLGVKLKPSGAATKLSWKSSKPKVASVNSDGVLTAKQVGKAVITVTAKNGRKATVKVSVKKLVKGKDKKLKIRKLKADYYEQVRTVKLSWSGGEADSYELCCSTQDDPSSAEFMYSASKQEYEIVVTRGYTWYFWVRGVKNGARGPFAKCKVYANEWDSDA